MLTFVGEDVWRYGEDSDDNDESLTNLNNMRQEYNDSLAILEGHSSNEAMEDPHIPSKDKEVTKPSDAGNSSPNLEIVDVPANMEVVVAPADGINPNQVQDCRSAPYTSVGGVPRNSAEPPTMPDQGQDCRSAPYTSVGGVPRNSAEPPTKEPPSKNNIETNEEKKTSKRRRNTHICAMAHCPNPDDQSYYTFPNPDKEKVRCKEWVVKCKRKENNKLNPKTARICGRHFSPKCFKSGGQRKLLREDAIPDQDLPDNRPSSVENFKRTSTTIKLAKEKKEVVSVLPAPSPSLTSSVGKNKNTVCAVEICDSPADVKYFYFSKENNDEFVRATGREPKDLPNKPRICELHFTPEDFIRDLKNELTGNPLVKKLKPGAIPTMGVLRSIPLTPKKKPNEEKQEVSTADFELIDDILPKQINEDEKTPRDQRAKKQSVKKSLNEKLAAPKIVETRNANE